MKNMHREGPQTQFPDFSLTLSRTGISLVFLWPWQPRELKFDAKGGAWRIVASPCAGGEPTKVKFNCIYPIVITFATILVGSSSDG